MKEFSLNKRRIHLNIKFDTAAQVFWYHALSIIVFKLRSHKVCWFNNSYSYLSLFYLFASLSLLSLAFERGRCLSSVTNNNDKPYNGNIKLNATNIRTARIYRLRGQPKKKAAEEDTRGGKSEEEPTEVEGFAYAYNWYRYTIVFTYASRVFFSRGLPGL